MTEHTQIFCNSLAEFLSFASFFMILLLMASLVAQMVKNLPAMSEAWVQSLGLEDPLEKRMATHSRILAWRIPWTEEPGGYTLWGHKESDTTEAT